MITIDTIKAARDGDFEAIREVVTDTESRVLRLAQRAASKLGAGADTVDEFRQVATIEVWAAINRFQGDSVDHFYAYAYRSAEGAVRDAGWGASSSVPEYQMAAFAKAVERADGDIELATKLVQIHPYSSHGRLSSDSAYAARLAWVGCDSLSVTHDNGESRLGDKLATTDDHAASCAPSVSRNKIVAAFSALEDYVSVSGNADELLAACEMVANGVVTETALDILSENIRLPKNRKERLFVQGAFGILAAAARSADHSATPADEYDDQTEENPEQRAHVARAQSVRAILDVMSEKQRTVLQHSFGIRGATVYGKGQHGDDAGMSEETGLAVSQIRNSRKHGLRAFSLRWIKAMSRGPADAAELAAAADICLGRAGMKQ